MEIDSSSLVRAGLRVAEESALFNGREMSEASATLCGESPVDVEMSDVESPLGSIPSDKRFTVSVDFGTTFSSISFTALSKDELNPIVYPDQIQSIVNYPHEPPYGYHDQRKEVPTESWYPNKALIEISVEDEAGGGLFDDDMHENEDEIRPEVPNEDENNSIDGELGDDDSKDFFWGYEVQNQLQFPDTNRNQNRRIARSKLLLDTSEHTQRIRDELQPILRRLKNKKLIKSDEDVIADYLEHLFRHAKDQLTTHHGFSITCPVEFVLCVPAMWTQKASRTMQRVMETAIRKSGFGSVQNGSVENLFIVSEPEAASAYVLEDTDEVKPGETFVLIDAGGGTVDAITYRVNNHYPLRLEREAFEPGGDLCGSSYLNEAFQIMMLERLKDERYLERDGLTIQSIVDRETVKFENEMKRIIDVTKVLGNRVVFIQGLKANNNPQKRFTTNRVKIELDDIKTIFRPILERVAKLMKTQLNLAKERNLDVKKVILIGGFAASPSLRNYLSKELAKIPNSQGGPIQLIDPRAPETAVASGAVLRALNKAGGPARITLSSYGFLRTEPHEPEVFDAHKEVKRPWHDPLDGKKYVKNTIDWLVKKGETIPPQKEYSIPVVHVFPVRQGQRFICREVLYVSDISTESHYRKNDPRNAGAEIAGEIETDMTFLKTNGLIFPVEPEEGEKGRRHYKVEYELVMIIDGRNLRYEARYPAGGAVQNKGQISIAAAFVPGTN